MKRIIALKRQIRNLDVILGINWPPCFIDCEGVTQTISNSIFLIEKIYKKHRLLAIAVSRDVRYFDFKKEGKNVQLHCVEVVVYYKINNIKLTLLIVANRLELQIGSKTASVDYDMKSFIKFFSEKVKEARYGTK